LILSDLFTGHEPGRDALLRGVADRQFGPARFMGGSAGFGTVADGIGIWHNHSRPWPAVFRKCKDPPPLRPADVRGRKLRIEN
jgi:hypothetical protein